MFYKKEHVQSVADAFSATGVPVKKLPLLVGASDASAFHIEGIPAVCIIGMDSEKLYPIYHTRLDTIDKINPQALEAMKKVLINFVEAWDGAKTAG